MTTILVRELVKELLGVDEEDFGKPEEEKVKKDEEEDFSW